MNSVPPKSAIPVQCKRLVPESRLCQDIARFNLLICILITFTMVFTQGQLSDIKQITKNAVKVCLSDSDFIDLIAAKLSNTVTEKLEIRLNDLTAKYNALEGDMQQLKKVNTELVRKVDHLEQAENGRYLRVYGLAEEGRENVASLIKTKLLAEKMNIKSEVVVEGCYRLGKKAPGKPRPIRIKFASAAMSNIVFSNKKALKGTRIVIAEELTKFRYEILKAAKEKLGRSSAWSWRGSIYVKVDGNKKIVHSIHDLEKFTGEEGA